MMYIHQYYSDSQFKRSWIRTTIKDAEVILLYYLYSYMTVELINIHACRLYYCIDNCYHNLYAVKLDQVVERSKGIDNDFLLEKNDIIQLPVQSKRHNPQSLAFKCNST